MWAFISPCAFSDAVLQMHALNAWQSPNILAHKWGGGGGPPLGEFNGIGLEIWSGDVWGPPKYPANGKDVRNLWWLEAVRHQSSENNLYFSVVMVETST